MTQKMKRRFRVRKPGAETRVPIVDVDGAVAICKVPTEADVLDLLEFEDRIKGADASTQDQFAALGAFIGRFVERVEFKDDEGRTQTWKPQVEDGRLKNLPEILGFQNELARTVERLFEAEHLTADDAKNY